ncbi:MAG: AbrB/MazE/SpoVT family DNA-binding domain-containing protein, partial [Clostridiales bacterium]|nr:AbrB/MazE/SpoVT family DNA-binding domain-containing protein [Clostridiales bacterium]
MKATGIVRKLDNLGRVTLPIELRRSLNLDLKDPVEIFVDGDSI